MSLKRYWYCFQSMNVDLRNMFNILTISAISRFACQKEKRKKVCSNIMFCWLLTASREKNGAERNEIVISSAKWTSRLWPTVQFILWFYHQEANIHSIHLNSHAFLSVWPLFMLDCISFLCSSIWAALSSFVSCSREMCKLRCSFFCCDFFLLYLLLLKSYKFLYCGFTPILMDS